MVLVTTVNCGATGGVNILCNALKPYFPVIKFGDGFNQMLERPSKPVKPPDNKGISFPDIL
jgi:hypothetical protein